MTNRISAPASASIGALGPEVNTARKELMHEADLLAFLSARRDVAYRQRSPRHCDTKAGMRYIVCGALCGAKTVCRRTLKRRCVRYCQ